MSTIITLESKLDRILTDQTAANAKWPPYPYPK